LPLRRLYESEEKAGDGMRQELQAARDALAKVSDAARRGEIGVLDVAKTCGGGCYTLWDDVCAALDKADAALAQPSKHLLRTNCMEVLRKVGQDRPGQCLQCGTGPCMYEADADSKGVN
jgi:hypothetical protein